MYSALSYSCNVIDFSVLSSAQLWQWKCLIPYPPNKKIKKTFNKKIGSIFLNFVASGFHYISTGSDQCREGSQIKHILPRTVACIEHKTITSETSKYMVLLWLKKWSSCFSKWRVYYIQDLWSPWPQVGRITRSEIRFIVYSFATKTKWGWHFNLTICII